VSSSPATITIVIDGEEEQPAPEPAPEQQPAPEPAPGSSTPATITLIIDGEEEQPPAASAPPPAASAPPPAAYAPPAAAEVPLPQQPAAAVPQLVDATTQTAPDTVIQTLRQHQMTLQWLVNAMHALQNHVFFPQ
jgi:hypothetical protein